VAAVDVERLRRATVGGQRPHQHLDRARSVRVARDELPAGGDGLGDGAAGQLQRGPLLEGGDPQLLQPDRRRPREALGELPVGGSPPQREPAVQRGRGRVGVVGGQRAGLPVRRLEHLGIDQLGVDGQLVARRPGPDGDTQRAERGPQPPDHLVQRVAGVLRRVLAPQHLDEAVRRDRGVGLQEQGDEERAQPDARQEDPLGTGLDLERTEDAEHGGGHLGG
jgi:hypothetical protein